MIEYSNPFVVLLLLIAGHALADFPLQGDFMAQAKDRNSPIGSKLEPEDSLVALILHCTVHAAVVVLITGSMILALVELVAHFITDKMKIARHITFYQDQLIHLWCKVVIWVVWFAFSNWHVGLHA